MPPLISFQPMTDDELQKWAKILFDGNGSLSSCTRFASVEEAYEYAKKSDEARVESGSPIFYPYVMQVGKYA